jgi:uncharacterized damage-inducible protein DinB
MIDFDGAFLARSRHYLGEDYLPKIERCLEELSEEDIWWRPNEASNSIGNLVLHLSGNVRQWIISGIGGAPDLRDRDQEFDQRAPITTKRLLERLAATVREADAVLAGLNPASLMEPRRIQGFDISVGEAVYHVVEHFGMHTGQITLLAKQRLGRDLELTHLPEPSPPPDESPPDA